jgi:hypothetical protein
MDESDSYNESQSSRSSSKSSSYSNAPIDPSTIGAGESENNLVTYKLKKLRNTMFSIGDAKTKMMKKIQGHYEKIINDAKKSSSSNDNLYKLVEIFMEKIIEDLYKTDKSLNTKTITIKETFDFDKEKFEKIILDVQKRSTNFREKLVMIT